MALGSQNYGFEIAGQMALLRPRYNNHQSVKQGKIRRGIDKR